MRKIGEPHPFFASKASYTRTQSRYAISEAAAAQTSQARCKEHDTHYQPQSYKSAMVPFRKTFPND